MCVKMSTALVTARQVWHDADNGCRWLKYAPDLGSNQYLFLISVKSPFFGVSGGPRSSPIRASIYQKRNELSCLRLKICQAVSSNCLNITSRTAAAWMRDEQTGLIG